MSRFTCPDCGMTSYHPEDLKNYYCSNCHEFKKVESIAIPDGDQIWRWDWQPNA